MPALLVLLATVLALGALSAPARADGEIGLSWDGSRWADRLPGTLFDERIRWVPGDRRTSQFFVRNQADSGADLRVAVRTSDRDRLLRAEDVVLRARVGNEPWVELSRIGPDHRLTDRILGTGEQARVQVRATFDAASTNQSQRDELDLRFRITLRDARAGGTPDGPDDATGSPTEADPPSADALPDTGARPVGWLLLVAGAMIGAGLALVRRRHPWVVIDA